MRPNSEHRSHDYRCRRILYNGDAVALCDAFLRQAEASRIRDTAARKVGERKMKALYSEQHFSVA